MVVTPVVGVRLKQRNAEKVRIVWLVTSVRRTGKCLVKQWIQEVVMMKRKRRKNERKGERERIYAVTADENA